MLSTIMFHYCRPIRGSRWPRIRGLELDDFKLQLAYLKRNYTIVSLPEVIHALNCGGARCPVDMPDNACLLTFDDGYLDHYQHVFPLLFDAKVSGAFFPIGRSVAERWVADVNKIHFILARSYEHPLEMCMAAAKNGDKPDRPGRFDDAETAFIKRTLQAPGNEELVNELFCARFEDGNAFADELYMTPEHIKVMAANGMHFGVHGWNHVRFSRMSEAEQAADLDASIAFLRGLGALPEKWATCYPYGAADDYDDLTVSLLGARGCKAAFTTTSTTGFGACRWEIPRLDTNDVPRS